MCDKVGGFGTTPIVCSTHAKNGEFKCATKWGALEQPPLFAQRMQRTGSSSVRQSGGLWNNPHCLLNACKEREVQVCDKVGALEQPPLFAQRMQRTGSSSVRQSGGFGTTPIVCSTHAKNGGIQVCYLTGESKSFRYSIALPTSTCLDLSLNLISCEGSSHDGSDVLSSLPSGKMFRGLNFILAS